MKYFFQNNLLHSNYTLPTKDSNLNSTDQNRMSYQLDEWGLMQDYIQTIYLLLPRQYYLHLSMV